MNQREEIWGSGPISQWHSEVKVFAVAHNAGRATSLPYGTLFDVTATWTGPPAPGFPPADGPVSSTSSAIVTGYDAAKRVAQIAVDVLRAGNVPDLRVIAGEHSAAAST